MSIPRNIARHRYSEIQIFRITWEHHYFMCHLKLLVSQDRGGEDLSIKTITGKDELLKNISEGRCSIKKSFANFTLWFHSNL